MAEDTAAPAATGTAVAAAPPGRKLNLDQVVAAPRGSGGGVTFLPRTMQECLDFATIMSKSDFAIPPKFRGNPGACLAVTIQACRWEADPFGVIQKAYITKAKDGSERLAYEAQLVAAVVNTRAPIIGRIRLVYSGQGATRKVQVIGTFQDDPEPRELTTPEVGKITVKNSPLWVSDPDQQLAYYGQRAWGRRWCPEVLLGIYTPDELQADELVDAPRPQRPATIQARPAEEVVEEGVVRAAEPEDAVVVGTTVEDVIGQANALTITEDEAGKLDKMKVEPEAAAAAHGISGAGLDVPPKEEVVFGTTPRSTRLSQEAGDPRDEPPPLGEDEVVDSPEFKTWEKYLHDSVTTLGAGELKTEADYDEFATLVKNAFKGAPITDDEKDDLRARFVSKLLERKRTVFGKGARR